MQEVAGAPILDYILKNLNIAKISEIIIFTSRNKNELEDHIASYLGGKSWKKLRVLYSEKCRSLGDCLRELSTLRAVEDDFLLIKGSCVVNLNFTHVLEKYEAVVKANNNTIMLKLFTKGSTLSELRRPEDNTYLMLDSEDRLLYIDNLRHPQFKIQGKSPLRREYQS